MLRLGPAKKSARQTSIRMAKSTIELFPDSNGCLRSQRTMETYAKPTATTISHDESEINKFCFESLNDLLKRPGKATNQPARATDYLKLAILSRTSLRDMTVNSPSYLCPRSRNSCVSREQRILVHRSPTSSRPFINGVSAPDDRRLPFNEMLR